ncbi:hypothetical protein [Crossiella sp. CA198]|uniref:hypothetical protein n=1 Tax=Crossiella sp. CA198 TaxID=3455607 RepID=UPI003F8D156A
MLVYDTKMKLYTLLRSRFGSHAQVTWADPGRNARRVSVWFGETTEPTIEPTALVAGRRKPSKLTAELTVRAVAVVPGEPQRAERAVYALRADIDAVVLDEFDLASVPGLIDVRPVRTTVTNGETGGGSAAQLDYIVRIRAHLMS